MKRRGIPGRHILSGLLIGALLLSSFPAAIAEVYTTENSQTAAQADDKDWSGYTPISSTAELDKLRGNLAGKYYLTQDIIFTEADFAEDGAFYNAGSGWEPVGTPEDPFTGILDGNGFCIEGLRIHLSGQETLYAGLFGVNAGRVENLGMRGGEVTAEVFSSDESAEQIEAYAGSIAGHSPGIIKDCSNSGKITASAESRHTPVSAYAGGIAGRVDNYEEIYTKVSLDGCYNTGDIFASAFTGSPLDSKSSNAYAGGIVGHSGYWLRIENCHNLGGVTVTMSEPTTGRGAAGGIAGVAGEFGGIQNCYNTGGINITSSTASLFAGGIAGIGDNEIKYCYNTGDIKADAQNATVYAGGVAGSNFGYDGFCISECYNTGKIRAKSSTIAYAGGITGINGEHGGIINCYNIGDAAGTADNVQAGAVIGNNMGKADNCYFLLIL